MLNLAVAVLATLYLAMVIYGYRELNKEAAMNKEISSKPPFGYNILRLGNDFCRAKSEVEDSEKRFLNLPNDFQEKEELGDNIKTAFNAITSCQKIFTKIIYRLDGVE